MRLTCYLYVYYGDVPLPFSPTRCTIDVQFTSSVHILCNFSELRDKIPPFPLMLGPSIEQSKRDVFITVI
jgi:hypothetical protein